MQRKFTLMGGAALGAMLALGFAASADAKVAKHHHVAAKPADDKVAALSSEVETLESRLEAETLAREQLQGQVQTAQAQAAAAQADADAAHQQLATQIQTIPGEVKSAVAAAVPSDGKIHYKGVTITPGGFSAFETVYRSKYQGADIGSSYGKIPFTNSPDAHQNELRFTARQSRYSALIQGDVSPGVTAGFYGEFDFLAGAQTANSNESNSFSPRIRHLYGQMDWNDAGWHILAGQNWSLLTLDAKGIVARSEVTPPTIEAQYVPGFSWARQPQIRVVKDFNKTFWVGVSLENPQTTFTGSTPSGIVVGENAVPTSQFDNQTTTSLNHVPDVIGKVAFDGSAGVPVHAELFGIYRAYTDRTFVSAGNALGLPVGNSNKTATGGGFGGSVMVTAVPKILDLQVSGMTGRGIGRYGSAQLSDVTLMPNGSIVALPETMALAGGTLHATPWLDFYVFGGFEREDARYYNAAGGHFGYGNPSSSVTSCFSEAPLGSGNTIAAPGACGNLKQVDQITAGLWDKAYTGKFGQVRVGLQYSHTNLTSFSAVGGTPKTNDDMIFTSFRYYPF
jgi:outer membrane murein-binding lipoprotein Lpp